MAMRSVLGLISALCLASSASHGFETQTHTVLSQKAIEISVLNAAATKSRLGLLDHPWYLGRWYIDIGPQANVGRTVQLFDQMIINEVRNVVDPEQVDKTFSTGTIGNWMYRGVIREDDNIVETPGIEPGVFNRVFGHFFDPVRNVGLYLGALGATAPDWALDKSAVVHLPGGSNHFTIRDANEAIWRALTLKRKVGPASFDSAVWPQGQTTMPSDELQKAYWATSFRALGHVVHLLQDMAQPQHTRDELHSGRNCVAGICFDGHTSFIERYYLARTVRDRRFTATGASGGEVTVRTNAPALPYSLSGGVPYTPPTFQTFREHFGVAAPLVADNRAARGLANFSNRSFYTLGTVANSVYPAPPPLGAGLPEFVDTAPYDMTGTPLPAGSKVTFKVGPVYDSVTNTTTNGVRLASIGAWDQFLRAKGRPGQLTLNHYVYDAQADFLIPRAVSYSAGLINFFYRGRLSVLPPLEGVFAVVDHSTVNQIAQGFSKLRVRVANASGAYGGVEQGMAGGDLAAVVKFRRNTCYTADLKGEWGSPEMVASKASAVFDPPAAEGNGGGCRTAREEIVVSEIKENVALGTEHAVHDFTFQNRIPINATDVSLQIVYRGALGSEPDAVVVETLDINEPFFVAYMNATNYVACVNGEFFVADANGAFHFPPHVYTAVPDADTRFVSAPLQNVAIGYGGHTSTGFVQLLNVASIPPGSYVRYAVLANLGVNWSIAFNIGESVHGLNHNQHPSDLTVEGNQVYHNMNTGEIELRRARTVRKFKNYLTAGGAVFYHAVGSCNLSTLQEEEDVVPPTLMAVEIVATGF